jgi:hypothetical protein
MTTAENCCQELSTGSNLGEVEAECGQSWRPSWLWGWVAELPGSALPVHLQRGGRQLLKRKFKNIYFFNFANIYKYMYSKRQRRFCYVGCPSVVWIRIQWIRVRIRVRIQGFDDRKMKKVQNFFIHLFLTKKIAIYLSLGLLKGRPSSYTGEVFSLQKTTSSMFYYRKTYALICNWACKPGLCIRRRSGTHVIPTLARSE